MPNHYIYTLEVEFTSNLPIAVERLNFTMHDVATTDHVEELLMHRTVKRLKECVAYVTNTKNVEGSAPTISASGEDMPIQEEDAIGYRHLRGE